MGVLMFIIGWYDRYSFC